jgi:hypothetical protein
MVKISFNAGLNKFEALDGKYCVSRCDTKDLLLRKLAKKGIKNFIDSEVVAPKVAEAVSHSEFSVNERFEFISKFVGMVDRKVVPSMIITGNGGIGKTFTVINTLTALGKTEIGTGIDGDENGDYIIFKGYSTAKMLYRNLYENNGKLVIFDDCDSVLKDAIASNILKGALDSNEKRVISWGAEFKGDDDLPNRFEFTGQVIFISNLPQNKFPQPLLSRSLRVDLTLTTAEVVDRIEDILSDHSDDVCEVINFIKKNSHKFSDLNIRSAMTVLKIRDAIGEGWEKLALYNATA